MNLDTIFEEHVKDEKSQQDSLNHAKIPLGDNWKVFTENIADPREHFLKSSQLSKPLTELKIEKRF